MIRKSTIAKWTWGNGTAIRVVEESFTIQTTKTTKTTKINQETHIGEKEYKAL